MMYTWFDYYRYSLEVGLRFLSSFPRHLKINKEGIKRILIPMDIARYFEIPETLNNLDPQPGENIFDLSSAKLVALFLANKIKCNVTAIDVWDKEIEQWKSLVEIVDPHLKRYSRLKLEIADGKNLPYPDSYFDKIYSISVIEHINPEKDGDIRTMKEIARILKPGGLLVLTVPYSTTYYVTYMDSVAWASKEEGNHKVIWARRYDEKALQERLINTSQLTLLKKVICTETIPAFSICYGRFLPFSALAGLLLPLFSKISLRKVNEPNQISSLSNVLLVLKKE